jgi:hypothetical protein
VLDAGSEPARQAYAESIPYDADTPEGKRTYPHARDTVKVSKTRIAKTTKNRHRLIEANTKKVDASGKTIPYLYYVEYGSTQAPPHPWIEKAYRKAQAAAAEPMKEALVKEFDEHVR